MMMMMLMKHLPNTWACSNVVIGRARGVGGGVMMMMMMMMMMMKHPPIT